MPLSRDEKVQILKTTIFFHSLQSENLSELADSFSEKNFSANHFLMTEGEPSEYFYVIYKGEIEISKLNKNKPVFLVALREGDIVGIIDENNTETKAIATAKTLAEVGTLAIKKSELLAYCQNHSHITHLLKEQAKIIQKTNFLRLFTPLKKLPMDRLETLAQQIKTRVAKKDEVLIREGEEGHECYLIVSGELSVYIQSRGESPLATLHAGQIFGEMALLSMTHNIRNSTIKADQDSTLYVLDKETFKTLLEDHDETQNMLMFFNRNRSRPKKKENIIISPYIYSDDGISYIFKNEENNKYLNVSEEGLFLFELLDGDRTLQELSLLMYQEKGIFIPEQISNLITSFCEAEMVTGFEISSTKNQDGFFGKIVSFLSPILNVRFSIKNSDQFTAQLYERFARHFFNKSTLMIMGLVILLGQFFYWINAPHIVDYFQDSRKHYWWLFAAIPLYFFTIALHEFAHAFTCKHFKRRVLGFGVAWSWLQPIAFCDTTDMWLAQRRERMLVNLAGCFSDLVIAGISAIGAYCIPNESASIILWIWASLSYFSFILNLNPIIEFDGYYALMDFLEMPHLKKNAVLWLAKLPRSFLWNTHTLKVLAYWVCCFLYVFASIFFLMLIQTYVIFPLLPYQVNPLTQELLRWTLPFLILIFAFATVWNEIKHKI